MIEEEADQTQNFVDFLNYLIKQHQQINSKSSLIQSGRLLAVLLQINSQYFSELAKTALNYQDYLAYIDQCLIFNYNMKVKHRFKLAWIESQPLEEIIALTLFLALKSSKMESYVHILQNLDENFQSYVVNLLRNVEEKIQDLERLNALKQKGEQLEKQNSELDLALQDANQTIGQMKQQLGKQGQEGKTFSTHLHDLFEEKQEIMNFLEASPHSEYLELLDYIYEEQQLLIQTNQAIEKQIEKISTDNTNLQETIQNNQAEIHQLRIEKQQLEEQTQRKIIHNRLLKCQSKNFIETSNQSFKLENKFDKNDDFQDIEAKTVEENSSAYEDFQLLLEKAQQAISQLTRQRTSLKQENNSLLNILKKKKSQLLDIMQQNAAIEAVTRMPSRVI